MVVTTHQAACLAISLMAAPVEDVQTMVVQPETVEAVVPTQVVIQVDCWEIYSQVAAEVVVLIQVVLPETATAVVLIPVAAQVQVDFWVTFSPAVAEVVALIPVVLPETAIRVVPIQVVQSQVVAMAIQAVVV